VRAVALESNLESVVGLGLPVLIRTFLSWSLVVEIEGHWRLSNCVQWFIMQGASWRGWLKLRQQPVKDHRRGPRPTATSEGVHS
jgi:hypothetical protein